MTTDVDFDALDFEMELPDDFDDDTPMLPMSRPPRASMLMPTPFSPKAALELVVEPDKLFDFSTTTLSPQQQMYIMAYAVRGTQVGACKLADVTYTTVRKWMAQEEFSNALQNAVEMARDALEEELIRRAMQGSDRLLLAAVKAAKPEKYQPKTQQDIRVTGGIVHSWAELAKEATKVIDITEEVTVVDRGDTEARDE